MGDIPLINGQAQDFSVEHEGLMNHQESETSPGLGQQIQDFPEPERTDCKADGALHLQDLRMREFLDQQSTFLWSNGENHIEFLPNEKYPVDFDILLGHSGKAVVWKASCTKLQYNRWLACKIIKGNNRQMLRDKAHEEIMNMKGLRHPHVVSLVATFAQSNLLGILMYPAAKCNLFEYMQTISNDVHDNRTPWSELIVVKDETMQMIETLPRFFVCLSEALRFLHKAVIKHKDIKPENILIDQFDSPLITDFDISRRYIDILQAGTGGPTSQTGMYASPEAAKRKTRKLNTDVFSLGCVFMEMASLIGGKDLESFAENRRGCDNNFYWDNLDMVRKWATDLETYWQTPCVQSSRGSSATGSSAFRDARLKALPQTIMLMLESDPNKRVTADSLPTRFQFISPDICPDCDHRSRSRYHSIATTNHEAPGLEGAGLGNPAGPSSSYQAAADTVVPEDSHQAKPRDLALPPAGSLQPPAEPAQCRRVSVTERESHPTHQSSVHQTSIIGSLNTPNHGSGNWWRRLQGRRPAVVYDPQTQELNKTSLSVIKDYMTVPIRIPKLRRNVSLMVDKKLLGQKDLLSLGFATALGCALGLIKIYAPGSFPDKRNR